MERQGRTESGPVHFYAFTPKDDVENAQPIRVHEYGHTIQSLVLGPLMLLVGIVSVVWGASCRISRVCAGRRACPIRRALWNTGQAKWGELVTKEPAVWQ